jgi:GNAT superfamily N-acetyltransferase
MDGAIVYRVDDNPVVDDMVALRQSIGWDGAQDDFPAAYAGYFTTVSAYSSNDRLVGWASVVSDGVRHGFFADVIVHKAYQRRGIGRELVARAIEHSRSKGVTLFHADFAPENSAFYGACGFNVGCGAYLDLAGDNGA